MNVDRIVPPNSMERRVDLERSPAFQYMADDIEPGITMTCLNGKIHTLAKFYVIASSHWDRLEALMAEIGQVYKATPPCDDFVNQLKKGDPVAVYYIDFDKQWHRGVFQKFVYVKNSDYFFCHVFLVDYGDSTLVTPKYIRKLEERHIKFMKAQAIRCVAQVGKFYNPLIVKREDGTLREQYFNDGVGWTLAEGNIYKEMTVEMDVAVDFLQIICLPNGQDPAWEVSIHHIGESKHSRKIHISNVEREVLQISRGCYLEDDGKEREFQTEPIRIPNPVYELTWTGKLRKIYDPKDKPLEDEYEEDEWH